jgi:hypothetical protein
MTGTFGLFQKLSEIDTRNKWWVAMQRSLDSPNQPHSTRAQAKEQDQFSYEMCMLWKDIVHAVKINCTGG